MKFAQHAVPNKCLQEHHQRHKENQPVIHDGFLLSWFLEDCTPMNDVVVGSVRRAIDTFVAQWQQKETTNRGYHSPVNLLKKPASNLVLLEPSLRRCHVGAFVALMSLSHCQHYTIPECDLQPKNRMSPTNENFTTRRQR